MNTIPVRGFLPSTTAILFPPNSDRVFSLPSMSVQPGFLFLAVGLEYNTRSGLHAFDDGHFVSSLFDTVFLLPLLLFGIFIPTRVFIPSTLLGFSFLRQVGFLFPFRIFIPTSKVFLLPTDFYSFDDTWDLFPLGYLFLRR